MNPLAIAAAGAVAIAVHTAVNARLLRRPGLATSTVDESVAVLLPLRDEAHRVTACLDALVAQQGVPDLRILILDDSSTDGTADVVRARTGTDPRVRLLTGAALPPGWLGKPHACAQLADAATDAADPAGTRAAEVLVFVDADVVLAPHAVAASVALLRSAGADLLSPYPRIIAPGPQRLAQPLLQWSWLAFLPLRAMERSRRASLAAAGGQFMVADAAAYRRAGGHAAVRGAVLEDIELAREVKRSGGRVALADGSDLAECRMYDTWQEMVDGYTKSLWASSGAAAGTALLLLLYVAPLAAPPWTALVGYAAGVASRALAARATGGRAWPDALAHPLSVLVFTALVARSYARRRRVTWKGRPVRVTPQ